MKRFEANKKYETPTGWTILQIMYDLKEYYGYKMMIVEYHSSDRTTEVRIGNRIYYLQKKGEGKSTLYKNKRGTGLLKEIDVSMAKFPYQELLISMYEYRREDGT